MQITSKSAAYAVVRTAYHGGGVESVHKSLTAAERAAKAYRRSGCECGCCTVIPITAQARQAMKDGDYIGARAPYGYRKDPDNCHKLLIDENTAPVVKQIFEWAHEHVALNPLLSEIPAYTGNEVFPYSLRR